MKRIEKAKGPRSAQFSPVALESPRIQTIPGSETFTTTVEALNKKLDVLVQNNAELREEVRKLSQAVQSCKRDQQRVENVMTKMTTELKVKFESMLEKSENRILGPVDRLLEELRGMRANPPPPVHVPVFPPTAPYPPEPPVGNSEWPTQGDYASAEPYRPHYQENHEKNLLVRLACQFVTS